MISYLYFKLSEKLNVYSDSDVSYSFRIWHHYNSVINHSRIVLIKSSTTRVQ
jgi:predicted phosphohydrolase